MGVNSDIAVTRQGSTQIIRFDRLAKKNAITRAMYAAMTAALEAAETDDAVAVHVVLGGEGVFSAGNDIADFAAATAASGPALGDEVLGFLDALTRLEKPIVSGVDGMAVGIGTTMHLHCDLTLATPRAVFRTPFVDLGLVPEGGSSLLGPAMMGRQRAFALLALGEDLPAQAALAAGLIWRVVPEDVLEDQVMATAERLAAKPPQALRTAKALLVGDRQAVRARIDDEARHFAERLGSAEAQAAFARFLKR